MRFHSRLTLEIEFWRWRTEKLQPRRAWGQEEGTIWYLGHGDSHMNVHMRKISQQQTETHTHSQVHVSQWNEWDHCVYQFLIMTVRIGASFPIRKLGVGLHEVPRATVTNSLNNRISLSSSSGGQQVVQNQGVRSASSSWGLEGHTCSVPLSLAVEGGVSQGLLTSCFLCVQISQSYEDTSHIGSGSVLIISFFNWLPV
jgi:hypothetical protein